MVDVGTSNLLFQTFGGGSLVEPPTTASQGSFFVEALTFVVVAKQCRQKAASVSQTIARRRISRPLLCKSNTMPKLGARVCGLMCFAKTTEILFTLSPAMPFFFGKFELREDSVPQWW